MHVKVLTVTGILATALAATIASGRLLPSFPLFPLTVDQDKKVSMDFKNAPAQEVFDWLKKSGVNFVVESGAIPKDKKITAFVQGRSIDEAVEAIAEALGMSVSKNGETYSLRPGGAWTSFGDADFKVDGKAFVIPKFDHDKLKAWELYAPGASQDWEKWSQEFQDSMRDLPKGGWDKKEWEKWSKEFKDSMKDMPKWKGLPEDFEMHFKDLPPLEWKFDGLKDLKGLEKLKDMKDFELRSMKFGDIGKLVESLTPGQLERNRSQGYLTVDDLTPDQKKLLGSFDGDGDFTIKFERDGKTVTIKRK